MRARWRKGVYLIVPLITLELRIWWGCGLMVMVVFSVFLFYSFSVIISFCVQREGVWFILRTCAELCLPMRMCTYISVFMCLSVGISGCESVCCLL